MKTGDNLFIYNIDDFENLKLNNLKNLRGKKIKEGTKERNKNDLNSSELILLSCLINVCKKNKKSKKINDYACFLTNKELSESTGLSIDCIKDCLKILDKIGFIWIYNPKKVNRKIEVNMNFIPFSKEKFKGFSIPLSILKKEDLSSSEKLLLGYILSYGLKDNDFFVQNKQINKILKIKSRNTIALALKKFKELGLVDVAYSKGKNTNLPIKRSIKLNKDKYTNYIEKIEINIDNTKNITNNMTYNDYRVTNNNYYELSISFKSKEEAEEFIKTHDIKNIFIKK